MFEFHMHYATVFSYYKKWNKVFMITQLIRHNTGNQNFLLICSYSEIKDIKCRILLPKERLAQYFFTVRSSFKHPHYRVVNISIRHTAAHLSNYYSVCKSPLPSWHSSFFPYVNYGVRFGPHHQPP